MAKFAEDNGAKAVMCMPPFFGRWRAGLSQARSYFEALNEAVNIPIILQDHQLSDISLPVNFLADLSNSLQNLKYIKLESGNIIQKGRELMSNSKSKLDGVFGGNSGIFLPEEYQAGCCGTMPACYMPSVFRKTWDLLKQNQYSEAVNYFKGFSRLAAYEKDVANNCLWKEILKEKGIIKSANIRGPKPPFFNKWFVDQLITVAKEAGLKL
jgi:dihydrodipicolinate synthase/N-acetylneuraminate lyase